MKHSRGLCIKGLSLRIGLIGAILYFISCAVIEAPEGGPIDDKPPRITGVYPAPNSVNSPTELNIHLQFDEWISQSLPPSAVLLSPLSRGKIKTIIKGDYLTITSDMPLDTGITYSLIISRDLNDLRGNAIAKPFSLVFSTGSQLDSLVLSGKVDIGPQSRELRTKPTIALYPVGAVRQKLAHLQFLVDSTSGFVPPEPSIHLEKPYYISTADSAGVFDITGLKPGKYRIVAFRDENGNFMPDADFETIALGESDIQLDSVHSDIFLALNWMDSSMLELLDVKPFGDNRLLLSFNRRLHDTTLYTAQHYELLPVGGSSDSSNNDDSNDSDDRILHPQFVYKDPASGWPVLQFDSLTDGKQYTIHTLQLQDSIGRVLDTSRAYSSFIWAQQTPDSLKKASILKTIPPNGYAFVRPGDSLHLLFNQPIVLENWANRTLLLFFKDTIAHTLAQTSVNTLSVIPASPFPTNGDFTLQISHPDTITQLARDTLADSSIVIDSSRTDTIIRPNYRTIVAFNTIQEMKQAKLQGSVPNANERTKGALWSVQEKKEIPVPFTAQGTFVVDSLQEGPHVFTYFMDHNGNHKRDHGRIYPFAFAEPQRSMGDTLFIKRGENTLDSLVPFIPPLPPF
jgi:hypothetical protein